MRIALGIEYDGTGFHGWQRMSHGPSVQAAVETALSRVADEAVRLAPLYAVATTVYWPGVAFQIENLPLVSPNRA